MAERQSVGRGSEVLRVTGALVATLPVAVLAAVCLAVWLPGDSESRMMLGLTLALPLWVLGMCNAFLARSGARVWLWCGVTSVAVGVLTYAATP